MKKSLTIILGLLLCLVVFSAAAYAAPDIDFNVETIENFESADVNGDIGSLSGYAELMSSLEGSGTEDDPYIIYTAEDLKFIAESVNTGLVKYVKGYYELADDIDLGGEEWTPIGDYTESFKYNTCFQGVFDGKGYTISNFKITEGRFYTGFFGYTYNADIKNLTLTDFSIDISHNGHIYTGGLVGRYLVMGAERNHYVENCHIRDADIKGTSVLRVYGGGLIGYFHSSEDATGALIGSSSDARCTFKLLNTNNSTETRYQLSAGGLVGYTAAYGEATANITTCSSFGTLITEMRDVTKSYRNNIHVGGLFGDVGAEANGTLNISKCYSAKGVISVADGEVYLGSIFGYTIANGAFINIADCYANSNAYSRSYENDSWLASFSGIIATTGTSNIEVKNCYTAGNAINLGTNPTDGGRFTAYKLGSVDFKNCYALESCILAVNREIITVETIIPSDKATDLFEYVGLDAEIWKAGNEYYPYPVLIDNEVGDVRYTMFFADNSGKIYTETNTVEFGGTVEYPTETPEHPTKLFSHWSLVPGGDEPTDFGAVSDTLFIPVFDGNKSFEITFVADGIAFHKESFEYDSYIDFPDVPTKESDGIFRYAFDHWSDEEDGEAIDTNSIKVSGEATYYVVYKAIPPQVWDGSSETDFKGGSGTEADPYIISDGYMLKHLANVINDGNSEYASAYYRLDADISLNNSEWVPIGTPDAPFSGAFDGHGYEISSFKITDSNALYAGLFGYIENAVVTQLQVKDYTINITYSGTDISYAGGIAAFVSTSANSAVSNISLCTTSGTIDINGDKTYAGGIVGKTEAFKRSFIDITNCYSNSQITANGASYCAVGGIAGRFSGSSNGESGIDKCYFNGSVSADSVITPYAAGICAVVQDDSDLWIENYNGSDYASLSGTLQAGTIKNCLSAATRIVATENGLSQAGHIYATKNNDAIINNCYYVRTTTISALKVAEQVNTSSESKAIFFNDPDYCEAKLGFDFENTWVAGSGTNALPVLNIFAQVKNVFTIKEINLDKDESTFTVSLEINYRDIASYVILVGVYDERGKMLNFKTATVENTGTPKTTKIYINDTGDAVDYTVSVVDAETLELLENPIRS